MQIKSNVDIFNASIKRSSKFSGLIRAEIDPDSGEVVFRTLFDNYIFSDIERASGSIQALGLNDLRAFDAAGEATLGTRQGLTQVADKAKLINEAIRNADPIKRDLLRRLGLESVLDPGAEVGMTYAQFNHLGKAQNLKSLLKNKFVQNAGKINITDEGATVINYNVGTELLTSLQAKDLENALGLGDLTPSFVRDVLSGDYGKFGKLPKRMQSLLSPRGVSISGDVLGDLTAKTYVYDDVELFFKSIFNPEDVSKIDRYLMSAGIDMTEGGRRRLMNASFGDPKGKALLDTYSGSLAEQLSEISPGLTRGQIFNDLKNMYASGGSNLEGLNTKIKDILENDKWYDGSTATPDQKKFALSIKASIKEVERMRDGEFIANLNFLKEQKKALILEKNKLTNLGRPTTLEEFAAIDHYTRQIDAIDSMAKTSIGTGKDKSAIARWFFGEGTFLGGMTTEGAMGKGEAALIDFADDLPTEFKGIAALVPLSALKTEVTANQSSILFDVAKSSKNIVYSDPLMLAYDSEYMNSPELRQAIKENAKQKIKLIEDFQKTGALPEEAREAIFSDIEDELRFGLSEDAPVKNLGIKFSDLAPGAKASVLRNRQEVDMISQMLKAGVPPQDIPQLLSRVTNYFATQAYRMKGDRVDLALPDTMRTSLRTYQSRLRAGDGVKLHEKVSVKVSKELAQSPNAALMGLSNGVGEANFLQFTLQGKTMMMAGTAASLYHNALGTFDLDDSGVDMMSTFKDADGNNRMAFMIYRQPTGLQEKIFGQANLTHNQTLKTILETKHGDFRGLINDPRAIYSLSVKEREILSIAEKVMNGEQPKIKELGYSSADIEKVLIKLRITHGKDHGFKPLNQILSRDLDQLVVNQSASALGTNNVMAHLVSGKIDHASYMKSLNLSPSSAPMYSQGNFINLITDEVKADQEARFVRIYNEIMGGTSFTTAKDILDDVDRQGEGSVAYIRASSAVRLMSDEMMKAALPDVNNTLGLYINRQAASVAISSQVDHILNNELAGEMVDVTLQDGSSVRISVSDYAKMKYTAAIIPPSEAVDAGVNLGQILSIDEEGIRLRMSQLDQIENAQAQFGQALGLTTGQNIAINEAAAENMLNDVYRNFPEFTDAAGNVKYRVELGYAGEHALRQKSRSLGFVRARQIAKQIRETGVIDEGSLAGYDPSLFGETSAYARAKGKDLEKIVQIYIDEMIHGSTTITDPVEKAAVDQYISELNRMTAKEKLEKIRLQKGTVAFNEYAKTASYDEFATEIRETVDSAEALTKRRARLATNVGAPTPIARYNDSVNNLIESQRGSLDEIDRIMKEGMKGSAGSDVMKLYHQQKIAATFFQGISGMVANVPGSNALDITATLQSALNAQYGRTFTESLLRSDVAIDDQELGLRTLFNKATSRELSTYATRTANEEAIERVQRSFNAIRGGRTDVSLAEVTKDEAKQYLDYIKSYEKKNKFLPSTFDSDVFDFMRYRTGRSLGDLGAGVKSDAIEAFKYFNAQENLSNLADEFTTGALDDLLMPASDVPDNINRIIASDPSSLNMGSSVSNGAYTRVQDFMDSPALRQVYENPTIRRGAMGLAALAVFGFVYSARKDRTSDEMSGPPLLPGGSAYESDMPKYIPSLSNLKYLNPVVAGMQYKINVNGSQKDIEKMQSLTEGVVDGPVNSTMYNSLPRLGNDPYQNVASRF